MFAAETTMKQRTGSHEAWPLAMLSEVLYQQKRDVAVDATGEYSLLGAHWYSKGLYVKETKPGSQIKAAKLYRIKSGDFVYNRLFAWKGSFAVADEVADGCYVSNEFPTFTVAKDRVDARYLWRYFSRQSAWNEALGVSYGATPTSRNRLKERDFLAMTIPLPPVAEQRRIVAKIEHLAAKIDQAHGLHKQVGVASDALLPARINELYVADPLQVPEGWDWMSIKDLGPDGIDTVQTGPFGAQLKKHEFTTEGRPVLAIGNVQWGKLDLTSIDHVTDEKAQELSRYLLAEGDVLFTRSGTVGRSAVVPAAADGWLMTGHILRVRLDRIRVDPRYLYSGFRGSQRIQEQVEGSIRGATRAGFNTKLLERVELAVPPLEVQRRIVTYLDGLQAKVDRLKALQQKTAAELDALLPSILDRAFKGEL